MRDNFKEYIEGNIEEFDSSFDVNRGWSNFQKKNAPKRKLTWWAVAASIALLVSVFGMTLLIEKSESRELSEWEEVELFYQNQIDGMTLLVKNQTSDESILYDLEEMDKAFDEIKKDLQDDAANEEVIEAMMNHYRLKLEILERMLDEIKEHNEKGDTTIL